MGRIVDGLIVPHNGRLDKYPVNYHPCLLQFWTNKMLMSIPLQHTSIPLFCSYLRDFDNSTSFDLSFLQNHKFNISKKMLQAKPVFVLLMLSFC